MTRKLQSTIVVSGIECPALRIHIPCMAHVMQLAVCAFSSSLGVKCRTKYWEAHERDHQFGENESIHIEMSQRLRKEGNARINKVLAIRAGLAKIMENVHISRYFEIPETNMHIAENFCCIDYADTWSSNWVLWLSKSKIPHLSTIYYRCEDTFDLETGVASASLPITSIRPRVAPTSKILWLPATLPNRGWTDHCQVHHARFQTIPILDPVDIEEACHYIASHYHSV